MLTTTNEHDINTNPPAAETPLHHQIRLLEQKIDQLLDKSTYSSALQNSLPKSTQSKLFEPLPLWEKLSNYFAVEIQNPLPDSFNPISLRNQINHLIPPSYSKIAAIRCSRKRNLILYTSGNPNTMIEHAVTWFPGIPYRAIQVNSEDRLCKKILNLPNLCSSMVELLQEISELNPDLQFLTVKLLSPTVTLLIFPSERASPVGIFIFATYKKLVQYCEQTLEQKWQYQKRKGAEAEKETAREVEEEKSGAVEKEKLKELELASEMQEGSSEDGGSCEESKEEMDDQSMENS
ncbi:hypothetical protein L873DRAFT_1788384 [Choiromyces venosus 120613-1]|uniref:Uncharacterized protein n=1 Tax=Choiromyces venosus 120613-1 TaxID=1336337 RepID=A0A3N4JSK4_9PEZI|nr:hypothetical protein L873DRAFT_1788384 [Choiromyces venosus 120613-1]